MTDRQEIIINGVDVSGCDNFRDGYYYPGTGVSYKCDTNCQYACCVYKEQLQRKTAECEELKNTLNKLTRGVVIPMQEPEVINLANHYTKPLMRLRKFV